MESAGRTLVCSVLFLDIADYSQKPVAEQLQLKQAFNQALAAALEQVAPRDRIILDTGDGAAITFMGDPEDALFAAMAMRDLAASVPVRLGVNLGPVRLVKDLNSQMNIIGDGINVAQRVMSFSRPGQLLVSRSFYEVVSCLSRDYASLFRHEGSRTDKHVRAHEVYAVVGATPGAASASTRSRRARKPTRPAPSAGSRARARSACGAPPCSPRRSLFLLIIAGGVGARAVMPPEPAGQVRRPRRPATKPQSATAAPAVAPPVAAPARRRRCSAGRRRSLSPAWRKAPRTRRPKSRPPPRPKARAAWRSRSRPGARCWSTARAAACTRRCACSTCPPGAHTIEIRNSTSPAHIARVEVKPGEAVRIQHRFR